MSGSAFYLLLCFIGSLVGCPGYSSTREMEKIFLMIKNILHTLRFLLIEISLVSMESSLSRSKETRIFSRLSQLEGMCVERRGEIGCRVGSSVESLIYLYVLS